MEHCKKMTNILLKIDLYKKKIKTYFLLKKMIKISKKLTQKQLNSDCNTIEVLNNIKQIVFILEHINKLNILEKYKKTLINDIFELQKKYNLY